MEVVDLQNKCTECETSTKWNNFIRRKLILQIIMVK